MAIDIDWQLIGVFDPDGHGRDFCYTVGLHERHGRPELHLWSRPSFGDDPGDGFSLSQRDMAHLLNRLGTQWVAGDVTDGGTVRVDADGGATTLTFRFDPPVARDELEAFQAPPDATVVPVRWSLERAPVGVDVGVDAATEARIRALAEQVAPGFGSGPVGVGERFGPWTPVLDAVLARIADLTVDAVDELTCAAVERAHTERSPQHVLGRTASVARRAGRVDAHAAALDAVAQATEAAVRVAFTQTGVDDDEYVAAAARACGYVAAAAAVAWVVGEHLRDDELADAVEPLLSALTP